MVTARQITNGPRFGNATLDALLPYLALYVDFAEAPSNCLNKTPNGRGPITVQVEHDSEATDQGADGKGLYLDAEDERVRWWMGADMPALPGAEYSVSFGFKFPDATPAGNRTILGLLDGSAGAGEFDLKVISSGVLQLWNGSSNTTGTTVLSDDTDYRLGFRKRIVSGTPTYEVLLDGVVEITQTANANATAPFDAFFCIGSYGGSSAVVGYYWALSVWAKALSDAEMGELIDNFLQGANL